MRNGIKTPRQITEETEKCLRRWIRQLQGYRDTNSRVAFFSSRTQIAGWAFGAVDLWEALTSGWVEPVDKMRLDALAEVINTMSYEA